MIWDVFCWFVVTFAVAACVLIPSAAHAQASASVVKSIQPFIEKQEVAGAVMLVATKDRVLMHEAIGSADVAANKPMKTDAMFWIASQTKPMTAATVMMLVDEGKVSLDDPVEKYLPEFQGQMVIAEKDDQHILLRHPKHPITIKNVLSHTSGLPFSSKIESPTLDQFPLGTRVRSYAMLPLDFEPDTKYQYSNAGVNTAARIVEVVSGMPFEQFMAERLFKPLGMTDTTFWPTEEQAARIAKAYKPGPDGHGLAETPIDQLHYPLTDRALRFPMPAGGLFSTAHDLMRFYQMMLNGGQLDGKRCLSEAAVKTITTRHTPADAKDSYGLGIGVGEHSFGHGGAYWTNTVADTQNGLILVWLLQHASFPGDGIKAQETFNKAATEAFKGEAK